MKFKYFFAGIFLVSIWLVECVEINYSPQDIMVDITNDFGICVLQLVSSRRENVAFSPYGLLSVALVMYEGASGPTAAEIHNTLRLPWNRDITRVGFRDMHRYLKSYFSNDGFLRGLVLSKPNVVLHRNYSRLLQFYGFDINMEVDSPNYGSTTTSARPVLQDVPPPPPTSSPLPSTIPPPTPSATTTETTITTTTTMSVTTEQPTMVTVPITTPVPTEPPNLEIAETTKVTEPPAQPEPNLAASAKEEDDVTTTLSTPTTLVTTTTTVQPIINTQAVTTTEIPSNNGQAVTTTEIPSNNGQAVTTTEIPSNNGQAVTTTEIPSNNGQEVTTATTTVVQNNDAGTTTADESAKLIQSIVSTKSPSDKIMEGKEFEAIVEHLNTTEMIGQPSNSQTEINNPESETTSQIGTTMQVTEITSVSLSAEGLVQLTTSNSLTSAELNAQPSTFNFVMTTMDRADLSSENPTKINLEVTESSISNDEITEINLDNQNKVSTVQTTFIMSSDNTETTFNQENTISEENTSMLTVPEKQLMDNKDSTILQNNKEIPTSTVISPDYEFIEINTQNSTIIARPSAESIVLAPELTVESDITEFTSSLSNNTVTDDLDINTVNSTDESERTTLSDSITISTSFLKNLEYKENSVTEATGENVTNIRFDSNTSTVDNNTSVEDVTDTNSVNMTEERETSTVFNLFISEDNTVSNEKDKENYASSMLNETGTASPSDAKLFSVVEVKNSSALNITEESEATTMSELKISTINLVTTKNGEEILGNNIITERTVESLKNSVSNLKEGIAANIMSESNTSAIKDLSIVTEKNITIDNSIEETETATSNTYASTASNEISSISMEISSTLFSPELSAETTSESFQPLLSTTEILSTQDQNSDNVIDKKETTLMNGRTKRSFDYGFEHREGLSNWVPHYQDLRWGYQPSNEHWFFTIDGGENVPVLSYTAFLPFAYIPEISSLALQLPLDDPRYSILILLPQERQGLSRMLYSLQWCSVRAIKSSLKITAVYAVVPTFTIVKHINLVPALAQLGIVSLFDPFKSDLSAMSPEPNLFVRTVEQVVTVSLRKYYTGHRWYDTAPAEVEQHFIANHPFAYFVIDRETEVVLMSGTIVNPLLHNQQL